MKNVNEVQKFEIYKPFLTRIRDRLKQRKADPIVHLNIAAGIYFIFYILVLSPTMHDVL